MTRQETELFKAGNITVTTARFITGASTFAIANIASVSRVRIPANNLAAILAVLVGGLAAMCSVVGFYFSRFDNSPAWIISGVIGCLGGIVLIGLAVLIFVINKDKYAVQITTNAGQQNAVVSNDKDMIEKIVGALNQALIQRG